ncbi:hypothetical protein INR49_018973 [Caranx melampygus]|nr:hypothetical protein INR49_018973 [Caranx melampygus]
MPDCLDLSWGLNNYRKLRATPQQTLPEETGMQASSICIIIIFCPHSSLMMPLRKSLHSTMVAIFCSPSI